MVVTKFHKTCLATLAAVVMGVSSSLVYAADPVNADQGEVLLDTSAAIVNDDIILRSDLDKAQAAVELNFKQRGSKVDPITARRAALESLVTRSIILQQAKNMGYQLTDTQITQALAQAASNNNTTVEKLLQSFGKGSEAANRQAFAEELVINEIRNNQVRRRVRISDAEVSLLAKSLRTLGNAEPSYHLAQIILPLSTNATFAQVDNATANARKIKRQAQNGADFNALAAEYAQGSTAAQGGDLGYVPESQVPVPFLPALLKAKPGDVVGPIRSPFGLHLIKLIDVSHQSVEPLTTYKAKHILLTTSIIFSDEAARSQLAALKDQIVQGNISFADAAKKYSEDPGSAALGGELGYAPASRYDPGFAQGLVRLNPGQISDPIKSSFGWHLILLEDRKIEKNSEEAFEQRARDLIGKRLFAEESQAWERELRAGAYVRVTDPALLQANMQNSINSVTQE